MNKKKDNFYDIIGKKYGQYGGSDEHIKKEYPDKNPEDVFKNKLISLGSGKEIVLDLGCGDGRFTLSISSYFKEVIGIDISKVLLEKAKLQKTQQPSKVLFKFNNANDTKYSNEKFNIVYSRRGPVPLSEIKRILKNQGYFVCIEISDSDCKALKETFGRGQNFNEWQGVTRINKNIRMYHDLGFKVVFLKEYFYTEYYPEYMHLSDFLQKVPIFEDFNVKNDRNYLLSYTQNNKTEKGIKLLRHKLVSVIQKL